MIKWPNDILINGKKIAGILLEASGEAVIVGIGVNVNNAAGSFPEDIRSIAASLAAETGKEYDQEELMLLILKGLRSYSGMLEQNGYQKIIKEYSSYLVPGAAVKVRSGDGIYEGKAQKIDDDGALLMRTAGGKIKKITAGEILWQHAE